MSQSQAITVDNEGQKIVLHDVPTKRGSLDLGRSMIWNGTLTSSPCFGCDFCIIPAVRPTLLRKLIFIQWEAVQLWPPSLRTEDSWLCSTDTLPGRRI